MCFLINALKADQVEQATYEKDLKMATILTNLPSNYNRLKNLSKITDRQIEARLLSRFAYRYRLAKSFNKLQADGIGKTLDTYSAITKLFFAYTAYEAVMSIAQKLRVKGIGNIKRHAVTDNALAIRIRKNKTLVRFIQTNEFSAELTTRLRYFFDGTIDDICCVAYAMRSSFAHGNLTTTDIGTGLAADRKLIVDLADVLLNYSDEVFNKCLEQL
jgi:hypothetical protein